MSAPTSPAPRAATALRRVAALLRPRPLRAARARATGSRAGAAPSRGAAPSGSGPAVVTAPDRDALHRLLTGLLLQHPGEPMALLLVGLLPADGRDGVGDGSEDLLRAVVGRAADAVRDRDVVVRLPGGRLAVLVVGGTASSARRVGERVRAALQAGVVVGGALVDVDASVGAGGSRAGATAPTGPRPTPAEAAARCADRLLAEVDAALEVARSAGTGVAVVDPGEREGARLADLARLGTDLRRAIAAEEDGRPASDALRLRWQPRFDVRAGRWTTATARLVWADDARAPRELAAGTALAPDLLQLELRRALRAVVAWHADGVRVQAAVRVPGEALGRPGLVDLVAGALEEAGAASGSLRLLVDDDDVAADPSAAAVALARLSVLGVPTSVTGLGASRSSVAALGALPVDELVVDARLVASLRSGREGDARLVRAVVGLGHGLGLRVVAAGVDDATTHRAAVALGCDAVEGEHVGPVAGRADVAGLVLRGEGGDLLVPSRRPVLPAPRRAPGRP
ncbi:EAL domain-containing protein [uncultured Pseudokineococcus sp.]|uniref:EAL domain-containing protein n=1 Tax=uncultured Pseudokineococcus sp. TaxID=1642928 RepID=UPI00260EE0A5|nr:EAL domain-containing protein [uncultured Pseudokineococcus sp.]